MERIAIYGAGALAHQMVKYNERYKMFDIVALIDDNLECGQKWNIPVIGYNSFCQNFPEETTPQVIVSIGYAGCNVAREQVCKKLAADGVRLGNFISPGSNCWPGTIQGKNILVFDNAFIGVDCNICDGVIISEGCVLSHGVNVNEYVFFSDGVVSGGNAQVGKNSFIGLNATLKSSVHIGSFNIVGAAANVLNNTEEYMVTKGNPGRSVKCDTLKIRI